MQNRPDRSRKRYQTVLPSSVAIEDHRALEIRKTDLRPATKSNKSYNLFQTEQFGETLPTANKPLNYDRDVIRLASDEEQAARLTDALLPYERLVPATDFARILAAELGLLNEEVQIIRGQNSSETDRTQTDSSKSDGPNYQPSRANGSIISTSHRSADSPPTSDASSTSPTGARKERSIPVQTSSDDFKIRSGYKSRGIKVLSIINEPESSLNGDATLEPRTWRPSDNLQSGSGTSTGRRRAATSPLFQVQRKSRRNFDELRSLIPPPLPLRHLDDPTIMGKSSSPILRPRTSGAPEFECVEGVTLDTQPVDVKEKFSGLSLPEIEARDIRHIED